MTAIINTLNEEYTVIETGLNDSTIMNEKIQISKGFLIDYTRQFNNNEDDDNEDIKIMKKKIKKSKPLYNNTTTTLSSLSTPTLSTIKSTKSYLKQQYIYFSSFIYPLPSHDHHHQESINHHNHHYHHHNNNNNKNKNHHHHHSLKVLTLEQKYGKLQSKTIGKGAYANVKLIINKSPSSTIINHHHINDNNDNEKSIYAVKIFKKRKHHGKMMKKLISEYCIASTMDHPNIVKTYDFLKNTCGHYCLVMEYCSGGDLYRAIERDQLTLCKIKSYFKQLLLGLDYLHSLGVAHRDIKPENLMISKDGRTLKITDFGVAEVFCEKWQKHSRLSSGFCGSLAFIAPEIFLNHRKGYQAIQSDVWSVAIVFCCMWFKGTLFKFAEKNDYHYRLFLNTYSTRSFKTLLSMDDLDYRNLIYLMLNPNPNDRIQISAILKLPFISDIVI